ncbi:hypothetical protein J2T38_002309 [Neisseria perflava]|nr:hypothetical protein [Neisseria perflava]
MCKQSKTDMSAEANRGQVRGTSPDAVAQGAPIGADSCPPPYLIGGLIGGLQKRLNLLNLRRLKALLICFWIQKAV